MMVYHRLSTNSAHNAARRGRSQGFGWALGPAPGVRSVVDEVQRFLQILPRLALGVLIVGAQQVRRMIGDDERDVAPFVPVASQPRDAVFGPQ